MRILIVEDDADTGQFIARGMAELGHQVTLCADGESGLAAALAGEHETLVLDRMLPALNGLALLKALRAAGGTIPALILSAVGGIADRVEGLEAGADDYLVKPFAFSELAARVQALGRRPAAAGQASILSINGIALDLHRRTVTRDGRRVTLQPKEFALLAELMRNPRRIMTRMMLLERVWDFDFDPKTNIVETHLSRLRSKLNAGFKEDAIETIRGTGYMIRGH